MDDLRRCSLLYQRDRCYGVRDSYWLGLREETVPVRNRHYRFRGDMSVHRPRRLQIVGAVQPPVLEVLKGVGQWVGADRSRLDASRYASGLTVDRWISIGSQGDRDIWYGRCLANGMSASLHARASRGQDSVAPANRARLASTRHILWNIWRRPESSDTTCNPPPARRRHHDVDAQVVDGGGQGSTGSILASVLRRLPCLIACGPGLRRRRCSSSL
jgi:hypothetical protein